MPRKLKTRPNSYDGADAMAIVRYLRKAGTTVPDPVQGIGGDPVYARVDHGRWIVDCDVDLNAQFVDEGDKRFFCIKCFNVGVDGKWRRVEWPNDIDTIESALMVRPIENRNWVPGESVSNLEAENVAHGLPANDQGV